MNNLIKSYSNNIAEENENLYLHFKLGDSKYAINIQQIVEIIKIPHLDYPQKLPNNIVGLLNYNNFTINILDLRFYLDIQVTPYSISNQLLIVKTDEAIFGLLINNVEDIINLEQSKVEYFPFSEDDKIIEFLYKEESETISIINLSAVENILKKGVSSKELDIPSLFPQDDSSRYKMLQRTLALAEKSKLNLVTNIFSQDKFISFSLNGNIYCINLEYVKEFLKNSSITKIPCSPDYIDGVITLRGDFITIVNLKNFFNLSHDIYPPASAEEEKSQIIVIETDEYKIGFLVDEIFRIIEIPEELISQNSNGQLNKFILSEVVLEDKFYTILNMKNILSDERFFIEEKV